jgi:drug/metabolite transporter (DMT)-like permease
MATENTGKKGVPYLLLAVSFFGSVPLFLKYFTSFLDAWTVNGIRYGVAAFFWLPFVLRNHKKVSRDHNVWRNAVVPAIVNTLAQIGWALSPYFNDAGFMGFVMRSSFLFATVFGFAFLPQERAVARNPLFWIGGLGIIAGLITIYGGGPRQGVTSPIGMAILIGTSACWGLYGVFVRRNMSDYGVRLSFGVISLYTAVMLWIAMFVFGDWMRCLQLESQNWMLLVLSAMIGISFSHVFLYRAIHTLGPVITEGGLSIQPFVTAVGAGIILGERLLPVQWLGGIMLAVSCLCLLSTKYFGSQGISKQSSKLRVRVVD